MTVKRNNTFLALLILRKMWGSGGLAISVLLCRTWNNDVQERQMCNLLSVGLKKLIVWPLVLGLKTFVSRPVKNIPPKLFEKISQALV